MTRAVHDGQSLLGVAINWINNGISGDSNTTPDDIKFDMVCIRSFLRTYFTAMKLRQCDVDESDFHICDTSYV